MICRSPRAGTVTSDGKNFAIGSLSASSPLSTMAASNSDVNTFVTEPISNTVSPSTGRGGLPPVLP